MAVSQAFNRVQHMQSLPENIQRNSVVLKEIADMAYSCLVNFVSLFIYVTQTKYVKILQLLHGRKLKLMTSACSTLLDCVIITSTSLQFISHFNCGKTKLKLLEKGHCCLLFQVKNLLIRENMLHVPDYSKKLLNYVEPGEATCHPVYVSSWQMMSPSFFHCIQ